MQKLFEGGLRQRRVVSGCWSGAIRKRRGRKRSAPTTGCLYARSAECSATAKGWSEQAEFTPPFALSATYTRRRIEKWANRRKGAWKQRLSGPKEKERAGEGRKNVRKKRREIGVRKGDGERESKDACVHACDGVSLPGVLVGVPIYTRFVLAATKGASGRLVEGAEPSVRGEGEDRWQGEAYRRGRGRREREKESTKLERGSEKSSERLVRCAYVCARVASNARDEQRDDGQKREGLRMSGGEGKLEFPLLYAVDFAFERVAGSTTSPRPTTVCRLSGVDLPGGCERDLFRGSRRFIGAWPNNKQDV